MNNENQPIVATTAADLIAFVPRSLGFQPRQSLAVITLRGKATGATMRIDLPADMSDEGTRTAFVQTVMHYVLADDAADGVLMFVYTNEVADDANNGTNHYAKPYMAHAQAIETELKDIGIEVRGGWLITDLGWMPFFCKDEGCCILQQHEEARDSALNAHMVLAGHAVQDTPSAYVIDPAFIGSETAHEKISDAAYWLLAFDPTDFTEPSMSAGRALWHENTGNTSEELNEETACELVAYLRNPVIRERIMADILLPSEDSDTFMQVLTGRYTGTPDWSRVDATYDLLARVLAYTPTGDRAPVFCILGWLSWYRGSSSIAAAYFDKALEADAQHRLSRLMRELVSRAALPLATSNERTSYGAYQRDNRQ